jgi:radical SAM superfamily enzyme YgiQ (UPF0313 family)
MKVLLLDLSAKHIHKSLAPWYLKAYSEQHAPHAEVIIKEHTVNDPLPSVLDTIYTIKPDVLGFSCYIWNIEVVQKAANAVRTLLPDCVIILGGPEVSFDSQYPFADHVIQGAGEVAFVNLLNNFAGETPAFEDIPSPFTQNYFDSFATGRMLSVQNQLVYYESSRGCPFSCSYCLSSATSGVQTLPLDRVFRELDLFASNGAKIVKLIDRTFNADQKRAAAILRHILSMQTGCAFHFEAAADLFDDELLAIIESMPPGRVQFEIGIQSINPQTLRAVGRATDLDAAMENIRKLVSFNNTRIHLDLIAGLPFETLDSFKGGADRCLSLRPHMLQLGVLKMLKGTKIRAECEKYGYFYNQHPPYQVFQSNSMSYDDILEIRRVGQVVDRFYNKGILASHTADGPYDYNFFLELARFFGPGGFRNLSEKNARGFLDDFISQIRACPATASKPYPASRPAGRNV